MLAYSLERESSGRMMGLDPGQNALARYTASGDEEALRAIVQAHADLVYAACLRVLNDPQLADDAGQAVFLVFTKKAKALRADTPLAAWFYRTAVYIAQRLKRDRANRRRYEQEAATMRANEQSESIEREQQWQTLRPQLDALMSALPAAERDALVLRFLAGKTEPEAAKALGCPVGTLSARVSRAIARLRARLSGAALPAVALAALLETRAVMPAPPHFAASIHAACLGKAGATVAAKMIAEETMKALFWMKVKIAVAVLIVSAAVGLPVTLRIAASESAPAKPPVAAPKSLSEDELKQMANSADVVDHLNRLLVKAVSAHASEIDIAVDESAMRTYYVKDGKIINVPPLPGVAASHEVGLAVCVRTKILAKMNINERTPQSGRFQITPDEVFQLDVSTMPTDSGEHITIVVKRLIPVEFAPHALPGKLIYEHLVKTEAKVKSPIAGVIQGMLPENLLDCAIIELKLDETTAQKAMKIQCLKQYSVAEIQTTQDGKTVKSNWVGASGNDTALLPTCVINLMPDGSTMPLGAKDNLESVYTTLKPLNGTMTKHGAGIGMMLLGDFGFAPIVSTGGKARAINESWAQKTAMAGAGDLPETYIMKKIQLQDGRWVATLESNSAEIALDANAVPKESVAIGNVQLVLEPKSLTGDLADEVLVDVDKGAVVHQKRVVNTSLVYKLDLPDSIPEFIRKMAGTEITLAAKFTIEDTLIDEAQTKTLTGKEATPEALKLVKERWEKRAAGSDAFVKDLATAILGTLGSDKDGTPKAKPKPDEF